MKEVYKKVFFLLFISLLITNIISSASAVVSDEEKAQQDYYNKLKAAGLSEATITAVMKTYPTQEELKTKIQEQIADNQLSIEIDGGTLLISDKLKSQFLGTITNWWQKSDFLTPVYNAISTAFKSVFGTSLEDWFKWLIGIRKDGLSRLSDLIVGLLTSFLIVILYLLTRNSTLWNKNSGITKKRRQWLAKIIAKYDGSISVFKIILFTLIYFGLFQLPIINRILETITFYYFMPADFWANIFIRTLFSSLIIGFIPEIAQKMFEMKKKKDKMYKELEDEAREQMMEDMTKV